MTESTQPPRFAAEGTIIIDTVGRVNTSGAFCDLFTGTHPIAGKVALKKPRDTSYTDAMMRLVEIEAGVWIKLNHPRILKFLGLYTIDEVVYFASPYAEFGSLPSYLQSFPNADRGRLVIEIAEGLAYLHQFEPAIVHGDVKGNNVVIASDHHARLCDFGLARHVGARTATDLKGVGSTPWQSPEILRGVSKSLQSDVYAFGITIYEVLSGKEPYSDHPAVGSIVAGVLFSGLRPPLEPPSAPDGTPYLRFWSEATRCWSDSPAERPSMTDVLRSLSDPVVEPKAASPQSSIQILSQSIVSTFLRLPSYLWPYTGFIGGSPAQVSSRADIISTPIMKAEDVDPSILRGHRSLLERPSKGVFEPEEGAAFDGRPAQGPSSGEGVVWQDPLSHSDAENWTLPRPAPPMYHISREDHSHLNYQELTLCSRGVPFDMIHKYRMYYNSTRGISLQAGRHPDSSFLRSTYPGPAAWGSLTVMKPKTTWVSWTMWVGWNLSGIDEMDVDGTVYVNGILRDMRDWPHRWMVLHPEFPGCGVSIYRLVRKLGPEDVDYGSDADVSEPVMI